MQQKYQELYATAFRRCPRARTAQSVVHPTRPCYVLATYNKAPYVSLWLDSLYGQNVGNALNAGVVNLLAGQVTGRDRQVCGRRGREGVGRTMSDTLARTSSP